MISSHGTVRPVVTQTTFGIFKEGGKQAKRRKLQMWV
jgi:hypothetical protein